MFCTACTRGLRTSVATRLAQVQRTMQPIRGSGLPSFRSTRHRTTVSPVYTDKTHPPFAHYSQAIKAAGMVWLSGQIPADAQGNLIQGSDIEKMREIIRNTDTILQEAGSSLDRVVKVVVYVTDASIMPEFAKVYDAAFPHKPARSIIEVSKLPVGVNIQVDFIAVI